MNGVNTLHNGLPTELISRFCEAIQYSRDDRRPTAHECAALQVVLVDIAIAAHQGRVTPERVLIELKSNWVRVCHRDPSPDMHDPLWSVVVRMALDAYENVRVHAA